MWTVYVEYFNRLNVFAFECSRTNTLKTNSSSLFWMWIFILSMNWIRKSGEFIASTKLFYVWKKQCTLKWKYWIIWDGCSNLNLVLMVESHWNAVRSQWNPKQDCQMCYVYVFLFAAHVILRVLHDVLLHIRMYVFVFIRQLHSLDNQFVSCVL